MIFQKICLWLGLLCVASPAFAGENELKNNGFESGGKGPPNHWLSIWPSTLGGPKPRFERVEGGGKSGEAYGLIETAAARGYSSFTQEVRAPKKATVAALSGWVQVQESEDGAKASLLLLFLDSKGKSLGLHRTRPLSDVGEWTKLELEVPVPDGCKRWMVRAGVSGVARVAFDEIELVGSSERGELLSTTLAVHHGTYVIRTAAKSKQPWVALSIPFPFELQRPLAIRVTSEPSGQIAELDVYEDGENRPLRVRLKEQKRGAEVKLRIETLTWLADRPLSDGVGVELPKLKRLPKPVRQHMDPAPGLDIDSESVKDQAARFSKDDLSVLMREFSAYIRSRITYKVGSPTQGAEDCLASGKAVCTGFANSAASLLIASGVPTRILACVGLSGRLQEHYLVELWTKALGWSRYESTLSLFPYADSKNMILRIVYSDAPRNSIAAPIFVGTGGGATGGLWLDPEDGCWQGGDLYASPLMSRSDFDALQKSARESFEGLLRKPVKGGVARFTPEGRVLKKLKLGKRGGSLVERVDEWSGIARD